jgi:hypothetical protein
MIKGLLLQLMGKSVNINFQSLTVTGFLTPEFLSLVNLQPTMHPEQNVCPQVGSLDKNWCDFFAKGK